MNILQKKLVRQICYLSIKSQCVELCIWSGWQVELSVVRGLAELTVKVRCERIVPVRGGVADLFKKTSIIVTRVIEVRCSCFHSYTISASAMTTRASQQSMRWNNKKLSYRWQTARRVWRSVKVTKRGTIRYVRYGFLLVCYRNYVRKTFLRYSTSKMPWPWKPG